MFSNLNNNNNQNRIEKFDYELFKAVYNNDVKKVREMIDSGCDINMKEEDKGTTPIHIACARGLKQVLELLVQRGCDVNVQDNRGWTPLHSLVTGRYDILALWLIRQGSLIDIKDRNGFSAIDMAQSWFKKEMIDVSMGKLSNSENELIEVKKELDDKKTEYENNIKTILEQHEKSKFNTIKKSTLYTQQQIYSGSNPDGASIRDSPINNGVQVVGSEVLKIYYHKDSYKSIRVNSCDNTLSIIKIMCEKINMKSFDKCFDLCEVIKGEIRYLKPNEFLLDSKLKWPIILTSSGDDTINYCHFALVLRKTAPKEVYQMYNSLILI